MGMASAIHDHARPVISFLHPGDVLLKCLAFVGIGCQFIDTQSAQVRDLYQTQLAQVVQD